MAALDDALAKVPAVAAALADADLSDARTGPIRLEILTLALLLAILEELQTGG